MIISPLDLLQKVTISFNGPHQPVIETELETISMSYMLGRDDDIQGTPQGLESFPFQV